MWEGYLPRGKVWGGPPKISNINLKYSTCGASIQKSRYFAFVVNFSVSRHRYDCERAKSRMMGIIYLFLTSTSDYDFDGR